MYNTKVMAEQYRKNTEMAINKLGVQPDVRLYVLIMTIMPLQRRWHDEKDKDFTCSASCWWRGSLYPECFSSIWIRISLKMY